MSSIEWRLLINILRLNLIIMRILFQNYYLSIDNELDSLKTKYFKHHVFAFHAFKFLKTELKLLAKYELEHAFSNIDDEVNYFKHQWLSLYSKYFYYEIIKNNLSTRALIVTTKRKRIRLHKHLNTFIEMHTKYATYLEIKATHHDIEYFSKLSNEKFIIARVKATLDYLKSPNINSNYTGPEPSPTQQLLSWKGTKSELSLVIYLLHRYCEKRGGTESILALKSAFEKIYDVEFKNIYNTFSRYSDDMKMKFMDNLQELLLDIINEEA